MGQDGTFKGRHFASEVILWALRWYLAFPISYRDLSGMLSDRGVLVDHTTLFRWVQTYAAKLEQRVRRHLRPCTGSWRVDETYIKVKGRLDVFVSCRRQPGPDDRLPAVRAAGRSSGQALLPQGPSAAAHCQPAQDHGGQEPGLPARSGRPEALGRAMALVAATQCKYLNNIVEQDHRRIKRLVRPGLGFGSLITARHTLAGYEVMAMIRKGQVQNIGGRDMKAQAAFVADLFQVAA